jgi:hypothetical protein
MSLFVGIMLLVCSLTFSIEFSQFGESVFLKNKSLTDIVLADKTYASKAILVVYFMNNLSLLFYFTSKKQYGTLVILAISSISKFVHLSSYRLYEKGIDEYTQVGRMSSLPFLTRFILFYLDRIILIIAVKLFLTKVSFIKRVYKFLLIFWKLLLITFMFFAVNCVFVLFLAFVFDRVFRYSSQNGSGSVSVYDSVLLIFEFVFGSILYIKDTQICKWFKFKPDRQFLC